MSDAEEAEEEEAEEVVEEVVVAAAAAAEDDTDAEALDVPSSLATASSPTPLLPPTRRSA
jgi:hypothetical protein